MRTSKKELGGDTKKTLAAQLEVLRKVKRIIRKIKKVQKIIRQIKEIETKLRSSPDEPHKRAYERGKLDAQNGFSPREGADAYIAGYSTIRLME
jgi:hypothetical protein